MSRSEYDVTTFIDHETALRVGSMDFALPSLREGMSIKMLGGYRDYHFIVKSWEYVFGEVQNHGLVVTVKVLS